MTADPPRIRPLDPTAPEEVAVVVTRMRQTLMEVLGPEQGTAMYSMDWLRRRLLWHLDASQVVGQVFVAEAADGIAGHTIVRVESDGERRFGLFASTFVAPEARRRGVASRLIRRGEAWMREHDLRAAETYTATDNHKLIALFCNHGYILSPSPRPDMVILARPAL